jgi:exopolysaccharide biosynthesis polyprenyl glycosylphosphotransferase
MAVSQVLGSLDGGDHLVDLAASDSLSVSGHRLPLRHLPLHRLVPLADLVGIVTAVQLVGHGRRPAWAYALLALVLLLLDGGGPARIAPRLSDELPGLLGKLALPVVPVGVLVTRSSDLGSLVATAAAAMALVTAGRSASVALIRAARARRLVAEPTLIVGAGPLAVETARILLAHPEYGLDPLGFLDRPGKAHLPLPLLGRVEDLAWIVRDHEPRRVIVAFGGTREAEMVEVLRACDTARVEVHVVPRFFELGVPPAGPFVDDLRGIPLLRWPRAALRGPRWRAKRVFDIALASVGLVLGAPLFVIIALAVRFTSPGPVLFRQQRVGQRGRELEILKFRTLPTCRGSDAEWSPPPEGISGLGRWLRTAGLDELPQLINVLRGEMSLVGPRPERPGFARQFTASIPRYADRHRVPAGITGWAQLNGLRGDTSIEERARFDNYYIEHWSLWWDTTILLRSLWAVVRRQRRS